MEKFKVILDTDIGDDVDDAYALGLLLCSPEIVLEAVTVNTGHLASKALITRKMLDEAGRKEVPVYTGLPGRDPNKIREQAVFAKDYRSDAPISDGGIEELVRRVGAAPGEITVIAIGPMTNIGAAIDLDPDFGRKTRQLIIMGGSIVHGYDYGAPSAEYNIVEDVAASQKLFSCGADLVVVPLDATNRLQVTPQGLALLALAKNPVCDAIVKLTTLSEYKYPTMHDPRACAVLMHPTLGLGVSAALEVTGDGHTRLTDDKPNCKVIIDPQKELLLKLMWERYLAGPTA